MSETKSAYERSEEILTPAEFTQELKGLQDYARAMGQSNGEILLMHAGSYHRLFSKLVDSYTNMWEKAKGDIRH
jgi:hypothetical protein